MGGLATIVSIFGTTLDFRYRDMLLAIPSSFAATSFAGGGDARVSAAAALRTDLYLEYFGIGLVVVASVGVSADIVALVFGGFALRRVLQSLGGGGLT
jgi:hypothetical protein